MIARRTDKPALLLVDGMNLLWRAAFGFPARIRTRSGQDVTGLFGFFALLRKRMNELGADVECVVCFDWVASPDRGAAGLRMNSRAPCCGAAWLLSRPTPLST
jgi:5'-3' exonuclease